MKLYLLRHGQTDYNVKGLLQGDLPIPLNKKGIEQVLNTKEKLDSLPIDLIISSPIERALGTANIINRGRNIPIIIDKRLSEVELRDLVGLSDDYFDLKLYWDLEKDYANKINVESAKELLKRTNEFIQEIENKYGNKNILVVSHGDPLRAIIVNITGRIPKKMLGNGEVVEYEIGD